MSQIFGATILRNGIKYDYPFRECLHSLAGLCQEVTIALGNSEDDSARAIANHPCASQFHIIPTVWDENARAGGKILSQQTNLALESIRARHKSGWILYLQADEVLSDQDFAQIRADIAHAETEDCDAVSFRYLHFWHSYEQIAFSKRWYPQEIRAFRLERPIHSYGDAQSVQGVEKIYRSDVSVFHYGHVREAQAYSRKLKDFHRWWHSDQELEKVWARGQDKDTREPTLRYLGPHASFMQARIHSQAAGGPRLDLSQPYGIFGKKSDWSQDFLARIPGEARWENSLRALKGFSKERIVALQDPAIWQKLFYSRAQSSVPKSMLRDDARPWPLEFCAMLRFSEKGIVLNTGA